MKSTPTSAMDSTPAEGKHVYVVDDDKSVLYNLAHLLEQYGYDAHQFDSAKAFLDQSILFRPAVLVVDMLMPGMTGVELQALLIQKGVHVPTVFISGESAVSQGITAMKQGALDFLTKPFQVKRLIELIEAGLARDVQMSQAKALQQLRRQQLRQLKPREQEAFFCLAKGYSYAETMMAMQISLPTAKQYRTSVMRQLKLNSLSELIDFHSELAEPKA